MNNSLFAQAAFRKDIFRLIIVLGMFLFWPYSFAASSIGFPFGMRCDLPEPIPVVNPRPIPPAPSKEASPSERTASPITTPSTTSNEIPFSQCIKQQAENLRTRIFNTCSFQVRAIYQHFINDKYVGDQNYPLGPGGTDLLAFGGCTPIQNCKHQWNPLKVIRE